MQPYLVNSLLLITLVLVKVKSDGVSYNEYCNEKNGIYCEASERLICSDSICQCNSSIESDEQNVYIEEIKECLPVATKWDGFSCKYNIQCKKSKYGKYSRCLTGKYSKIGSCECYDETSENHVQLVDGICTVITLSQLTISSPANSFSCNYDYQCRNSSLGTYSRCNTKAGTGMGFGRCECFDTSGSKREMTLIGNVCHVKKEYGHICKYSTECNATIVGEAVCIGSPNGERIGICQCAVGYQFEKSFNECLRLGTVNSVCKSDFQCQHVDALGKLSRCHPDFKTCLCWDTLGHGDKDAKFHSGRCYYARKVNQTCEEKVECELGYHKNADCLQHESYNGEKVCQCPNGYRCENNSEKLISNEFLVTFYTLFCCLSLIFGLN